MHLKPYKLVTDLTKISHKGFKNAEKLKSNTENQKRYKIEKDENRCTRILVHLKNIDCFYPSLAPPVSIFKSAIRDP